MMSDDMELVREYARSNSEPAFATLASRHVNLVYSVALRQVRDPGLAEEITQGVFIILAQKAKTLSAETILSGWLCRTARYVSANTLRTQRRRQIREQESQMQSTLNDSDETTWGRIAPSLDEALSSLGEKEHDAIVLRFFDGKELKHIGAAMGTTEDAARMRVNRGLEKLREFFTKRGLELSTAAIAGAVAANSVQAAPAALATTITAAVLSGAGVTTAAAATATKAIAMTTLQKTVILGALVVAAGTGVYEGREAAQARAEAQTLQRQQGPLTEQIQQLQREHDETALQLASLREENERLNRNTSELLKLRNEAAGWRSGATNSNDPSTQTALAWVAKAKQLRQLFEDRPDQRIPDLRFLTDKKWLDLAKNLDLDSEAGRTFAIHHVRLNAKLESASIIEAGIKRFAEANNGHQPTDVAQLTPFLEQPLEDEILQRYRTLDKSEAQSGWLEGMVLIEKVAIDKWQETQVAIGPTKHGWGPTPAPVRLAFPQELKPAMESYQSQYPQKVPADFNELRPYLTTPEQHAALDKLLEALQNK